MSVLPPTHPSAPIITQPVAQRITAGDVAQCKERLTSREHDYQELERTRKARHGRSKFLSFQLRYLAMLSRARGIFRDVALGRLGPLMISICIGVLAGVVLSSIFSTSMLVGGFAGSLASFLIAALFLWVPSNKRIELQLASKHNELHKLQMALTGDEPAYQHAKSQLAAACSEFEALLEKFNSLRNVLLNTDWRDLRGSTFEAFLANVFLALGYQVKRTGRPGDQGVDLIVEKGGAKFAIQAKGYAHSVGNEAVREAFTGMVIDHCNRCAVITNSTFTPCALEAAKGTGCVLINGSQINALILGQIDL